MLEQLLEYHQTPEDGDFTARVVQGVRRRERMRRLILWGSGLVGGAFGVAGWATLADAVGQVFSAGNALPMSLGAVAIAALVAWLLHDETGLTI